MSSASFQYSPFSTESSIRLLRFKEPLATSAEESDSIEIELFEADISNPPPFNAISYAWGQYLADSTITCNGQSFLVTGNVASILRNLRRRDPSGALWIDSICINQLSIPERNTQVPKMRNIYREAEKVWVWLGEGTFEVDAAFDFLLEVKVILEGLEFLPGEERDLWNRKYLWMAALKQPWEAFDAKIVKTRDINDAMDTNFIVDLLNLSWFHRTVQELVLARNPILLNGSQSLSWPWFDITICAVQIFEDVAGPTIHSTSNPAFFTEHINYYKELGATIKHGKASWDQRYLISKPLKLLRAKLSSDAKDKVYGLYGIYAQMRLAQLPSVDYNKSVQSLYRDMTCFAIQRDESLDILYETDLPQVIDKLPSWVPDWSNANYRCSILHLGYCAAKRSEPRYSIDGSRLSVPGLVIDEIASFASSTSICTPNFRRGYKARQDPKEHLSAIIELIRTLQNWAGECSANGQGIGEFLDMMNQFHVLWNFPTRKINPTRECQREWTAILLANGPNTKAGLQDIHGIVQNKPEFAVIRDDYVRLCGCSADVEKWPEELRIRAYLKAYNPAVARFQHDVALYTYHRTLFTTNNGYIGIGPRWMKAGDLVALISGMTLPFVIRRNGENYTLVGPAYIEGIMSGHLWEDEKLKTMVFV
ncbi:hypothetical protein CC80DRAFT_85546 [Byssothecium circinans]|uniref:Heterokaryon incompatibility domain-containing protein n=1 Tax=Byssothecium circinans TaxID=147558 RepID=A0A6A5TS34_9PLEO|nr:hypothetical protein CC80DRAFT_85546 [Byssothecium circinans]